MIQKNFAGSSVSGGISTTLFFFPPQVALLRLLTQHHGCKIYDLIGGSQYIVWYLRAHGAKIGRRACL